ncbi:NAD(P)/FAD-dependent oxidoreductase [Desulfospira joergensenii]|uniref:NAD(P)/FAD-dependent oxidoreductase n=1 Tax=Desulfospira joergensenii TaxID=53329 RepID=UPI0003B4BA46|nr:NAD(P)/FAD-dependent oxidoreductase [Desulfospira joergensenii]
MADSFDVLIIGAGASGLMCAAQAGFRGKKVLVLDHGSAPGRKILMSGGGRSNFTNTQVSSGHYLSSNPHFCKSAISRYTSRDFIDLVARYGISFEERSHGQLFCVESASQLLDMLLAECRQAKVNIRMDTPVEKIKSLLSQTDPEDTPRFRIHTGSGKIDTRSLVIATGGVSIPGVGATPFGYKVAEQFGIPIVPVRPGLVPFTLQPKDKKNLQPLSGISVDAKVSCPSAVFTEKLLFTHRGLSGPVILQISSHWQPGQTIFIDLLPFGSLEETFKKEQGTRPKKQVRSILYGRLPKRLVDIRLQGFPADRAIGSVSHDQIRQIASAFHEWQIKPGGTEGNRTAEVTLGGVDCNHISSKTLEAGDVPGLFFIGEVLDVTGWLGGYNLQWAWSSGYCAGQYV